VLSKMTAEQLNEGFSELESQLKIKKMEIAGLKNDKERMIKQFIERKIDQSQNKETLREV